MYKLKDYHYNLPDHLIAQTPSQKRDRSRLLCLDRNTGKTDHQRFDSLTDLLRPTDVLVVNNTEVVPGRLLGRKETGGKAEVLILNYNRDGEKTRSGNGVEYQCLIKAAKRSRPGTRILFNRQLEAEVISFNDGLYRLRFYCDTSFERVLYDIGRMPLPPYIKRDEKMSPCDDRESYQTVYASCQGAIAAPTAGLHFTRELLERIRQLGVRIAPITLHVGYGTFLPVRVDDIREHRMHSEWFSISDETADTVNTAKKEGRRVIAVGTTSVRTLEYVSRGDGLLKPVSDDCDLFIYPGFEFRIVDAMITNFHLPESTLLMLVSAFAGKSNILAAYQDAIENQYRFFSYGDAMFIS